MGNETSSEEPSSSLDTEFRNQLTWRDVHDLEDAYYNGKVIQIPFFKSISRNKVHNSVNSLNV